MAPKILCMIVDDESIARDILQIHISKIEDLKLVATCKNAFEALTTLQEQRIDLIFLDIKMPDITGISLAEVIKQKAKVIFTTAYRDYAVEGFELQAVDYLLKPISLERFIQAIQKYKAETGIEKLSIPQKQTDNFIFIRSDRKMTKIALDQIKYIESLSDYLKIHLVDNNSIITRDTISSIENKLPTAHFIRIHRSFIISVQHIDAYTKEYIEIGNTCLPISRSYRESVIKRFE